MPQISLVKTLHNYSTGGNGLDNILPKVPVSTESAKKDCYLFGVQVFNSLPSDMRNLNSRFLFRKKANKQPKEYVRITFLDSKEC